MSIFGKILGTVVDIATIPVSLAKDVLTMGGVANGHGSSYTKEKLEKIDEEIRNL